jgi:uncharacterized short protein YbdD (DUF466 family)
MKKFLEFLILIKNHLNGNLDYQNYIAYSKIHNQKILSKKEFLLEKREEKSKKINRCC